MSGARRPPRRVLITGATNGLGRALALSLAADERTELLLHGRNAHRLDFVAEEVAERSGKSPHTFIADLADLAQTSDLASQVAFHSASLDVLVNNAGVGFGDRGEQVREISLDGHELRFAVNHLAGFQLTIDLLADLGQAGPGRVVFVASIGQAAVDFDDLMFEQDYDGIEAYRRSKLAQVMCAIELSERIDAADVTFNSVHPATLMPTNMVTDIGLDPKDSIEAGVEATRRLVDDPALVGRSGLFFDQLELAEPHPQADDAAARDELFRRCLELVDRPDPRPPVRD